MKSKEKGQFFFPSDFASKRGKGSRNFSLNPPFKIVDGKNFSPVAKKG